MPLPTPYPTKRSEGGANALTYVGMVVVAALIAGAIFVAVNSNVPALERAICQAIHTITGQSGGCLEGSTPSTPSYTPEKCLLTESGEKMNSVIQIGFIKIGDNAGFVVDTYSDGTTTVTVTDGAQIGGTGGIGAEANLDDVVQVGATADFGGGVELETGNTWTFKSPEEAKAMMDQLNDYILQQELIRSGNCRYGSCTWASGVLTPPKEATQRITRIAGYGEIQAGIGLQLGPTQIPGAPAGTKEEQPVTYQPLNVTGELNVDAGWVVMADSKAQTTTYTVDLNVTDEAKASLVIGSAGAAAAMSEGLSLTEDEEGHIMEATLQTTLDAGLTVGLGAQGSGIGTGEGKGSVGGSTNTSQASIITTTLTLDPSEPDYAAKERQVREWAGSGLLTVSLERLFPITRVPGDAFQNLLYDRATTSVVNYDNVTDKFRFAVEAKLGLALGVDLSYEKSTKKAVGAGYLGAPSSDGGRPIQRYTECIK